MRRKAYVYDPILRIPGVISVVIKVIKFFITQVHTTTFSTCALSARCLAVACGKLSEFSEEKL